jgi:hypothetical protein
MLEIFKDDVKKEKTIEFEAKPNMFNSGFFLFSIFQHLLKSGPCLSAY